MKQKRIKTDPEAFFKMVALNAQIYDMRSVKDVYYGTIRAMMRELKARHTVDVPDLGTFKLHILPERKWFNVNKKQFVIMPPKTIVKFEPDPKLRDYFYEFGSSGL